MACQRETGIIKDFAVFCLGVFLAPIALFHNLVGYTILQEKGVTRFNRHIAKVEYAPFGGTPPVVWPYLKL